MKKIKVVHLIDNLLVGGAEKQLTLLCESFDSDQFEYHVVCMRHGGPLEERIQKTPALIHVIGKNTKIDLLFFKKLVKKLKEIKPDVIHCWLFSGNFWGRLAAFYLPSSKVIATERVEGIWKRFYHRWIDKCLLSLKTDILLANSQGVIDYCVKQEKLSPEKIRLIFNAVSEEPRVRKYDPQKETKEIVTISRLTEQKGVEQFIKIAAMIHHQNTQIRFSIYGEGELKEKLQKLIDFHAIGNVCELKGKKSLDEIFTSADLYVSTSLYEGLPNSVMEAMCYGLPIVATDIGGSNELIIDGESGYLVPVSNVDKMTVRILDLLSDETKARSFGESAKKRIYENFSLSLAQQKLSQLYLELMNGEKK